MFYISKDSSQLFFCHMSCFQIPWLTSYVFAMLQPLQEMGLFVSNIHADLMVLYK